MPKRKRRRQSKGKGKARDVERDAESSESESNEGDEEPDFEALDSEDDGEAVEVEGSSAGEKRKRDAGAAPAPRPMSKYEMEMAAAIARTKALAAEYGLSQARDELLESIARPPKPRPVPKPTGPPRRSSRLTTSSSTSGALTDRMQVDGDELWFDDEEMQTDEPLLPPNDEEPPPPSRSPSTAAHSELPISRSPSPSPQDVMPSPNPPEDRPVALPPPPHPQPLPSSSTTPPPSFRRGAELSASTTTASISLSPPLPLPPSQPPAVTIDSLAQPHLQASRDACSVAHLSLPTSETPTRPSWIDEAVSMLTTAHLSKDFCILLNNFVNLERAFHWGDSGKPWATSLKDRKNPANDLERPKLISSWIAAGRFRSKALRSVDDPATFHEGFSAWLRFAVPVMKKLDEAGPTTQLSKDDLDFLRRPGVNGFLTIVVGLYWLGEALARDHTKPKKERQLLGTTFKRVETLWCRDVAAIASMMGQLLERER